jgi:hypothetical protein
MPTRSRTGEELASLTREQVAEIVAEYERLYELDPFNCHGQARLAFHGACAEIAADYGISPRTVYVIAKRYG